MMKKLIISSIAFLTSISIATIPTYAASLSTADVGKCATTTIESLRVGYEGTVIARMIGRSGSRAPYGAKGISFEVLFSDKKNLMNIGKRCITKLSESSIDQLADLVTISDGTVVEYIQCKNVLSDTRVKEVVGQLISNNYPGASVVTTSESAAKITAELEKMGVEAVVVDSGINHAVTVRIAEKSLGKISPDTLNSLCKNSAGIAAGVATITSLYDSLNNNDSFGETFANVTTNTVSAATSMTFATAAGEIAGSALASASVSGITQIAIPMVIVVGVSLGIEYGLNKLFDAIELDDNIAYYANTAYNSTKSGCQAFSKKVQSFDYNATLSDAKEFASSKITSGRNTLVNSTQMIKNSKAVLAISSVVQGK